MKYTVKLIRTLTKDNVEIEADTEEQALEKARDASAELGNSDFDEADSDAEIVGQAIDKIANITQAISSYLQIDFLVCKNAVQDVCQFYSSSPAEYVAQQLYFFLMDGQEARATVHQFRESVRRQTQPV